MKYFKVDLNNLPDFIPYEQQALTPEQFMEMYNAGKFPNAEVPYDVGPSAQVTPESSGDEQLSEKEEKVNQILENLENFKAHFQKRAGHDETVNPLEQEDPAMDDASLAGWYLFTLGIKDWTSLDAVSTIDDLSKTDKLANVTNNTSSSDSDTLKVSYLAQSFKGDLLFFDTYRKNSLVAINLGEGDILTIDETGIAKHTLWEYIDFSYNYTDYFHWFNGTIKRAPEYNTEGYLWYQNI